jgi:potassium efflux system protein
MRRWLRGLVAALVLAVPTRVSLAEIAAPDAAAIEQRIAAVKADTSLADADRAALITELQAALRDTQEAVSALVERDGLIAAAQAAPARIAALRGERPPAPLAPPASADLATLGAALADAQSALEAAQGEQAAADRRVQTLGQAPLTLQPELAQARADLEQLGAGDGTPRAEAVGLGEARAWARAARRAALQAGIALREEQLRTAEVRRELAQAERDTAERRVAVLQDAVDVLAARVSAARQALANQELADAQALVERTADAHPLIRDAAARQAELTRELAGVLQADDRTGADIERTQAEQTEIETLLRAAQAQLELAELSGTLAQALHDRRLRLTRPGDFKREAAARNRDIGEARLRQITLGEQRRELNLPYQRARDLLAQADPPVDAAQQPATQQELAGLLRAEGKLVERLDDAYARRIALVSDLGRRQLQLQQVSQSYADLLDRRLLWTPDVEPVGRGWPGAWVPAFDLVLRPARWAELPAALVQALATRPALASALLMPLVLFGVRGGLSRRERIDAVRLTDVHRDSAWVTARALLFAALRAAPWPLTLALLGRLLVAGAGEGSFADAVGAALSGIAKWVFVLAFVGEIAHRGGVLDLHYQWRAQSRQVLRRQIARLRLVAVPAGMLVVVGERLGEPAVRASLGRFAFVVFSLALAAFVWRTLHPRRGAAAAYLDARPGSRLGRWRRLWHTALVALPLAPAVFAIGGFYYAALQLQARLVQTTGWLLAVLLAYYLVLRALAVAQRRLRLKRALAPETTDDDAIADDRLDIEAVDEQARRLLGFVFSLAVAGVLLAVWADLLPALQSLDGVVLWRYRLGGDAGAATGVVTLLSVLLAGAVASLTVFASHNLPGVLEIAVLQRLDMDAGARYAAITVTRYVIITVGVLVAVNLLGLEWSKAQWLVAALGVGIGFGLQEIIANFISGLIILGERPFRVGDIVTVGGVSGNVARIRIRATTITDFDRKELIVPNKTFITEQFVNWTLSDQILRVVIKVGLAYGVDTAAAQKLLLDVVSANPRLLREPAPQVLFTNFGDSALEFEVRVHVRTLGDSVPARHELLMAINQALHEAGIEIPFPQRDVHLRSVSAQAAQAFGAPSGGLTAG